MIAVLPLLKRYCEGLELSGPVGPKDIVIQDYTRRKSVYPDTSTTVTLMDLQAYHPRSGTMLRHPDRPLPASGLSVNRFSFTLTGLLMARPREDCRQEDFQARRTLYVSGISAEDTLPQRRLLTLDKRGIYQPNGQKDVLSEANKSSEIFDTRSNNNIMTLSDPRVSPLPLREHH